MSELLNITIEILEMTDKKGQFGMIRKIKGKNLETGQTNTYTVYDKKKDGSTSTAWTQLQDIQVGETVSVGYAEQAGTMQDGTPFTSRIVRAFDKDLGNGRKNYIGHNPAPLAGKPSQGQNLKPSEPLKDQAFWDKQAYEKCCSLWAAAVITHKGYSSEQVISSFLMTDSFWNLFQAIKADGEKRFATGWAKAEAIYKTSTIQQEAQDTQEEEPPLEEPPF
jgi:hypothetical protein